jgi:hypothetical protein
VEGALPCLEINYPDAMITGTLTLTLRHTSPDSHQRAHGGGEDVGGAGRGRGRTRRESNDGAALGVRACASGGGARTGDDWRGRRGRERARVHAAAHGCGECVHYKQSSWTLRA